jgi:phospholipid-binding lipoprotein MlaA
VTRQESLESTGSPTHAVVRRGALVALAALALALRAPVMPGLETSAAHAGPMVDPLFDGESEAELDAPPSELPDPLEGMNRRTLRLNQGLDRWVLDPVTSAYRFLVPGPARRAVRRVLANLDAPAVVVNDLLQREWRDAGTATARFALNTTIGLAGILDPAARVGLEGHSADFGQTLALAGLESGPYLVLPVLGPTTIRDGVGELVDLLFRPTTYVLGPADQIVYATAHGTSAGFATREEHADALDLLEQSSVDYYAALRNVYFQSRTAEIWARRAQRTRAATVARTDGREATSSAAADTLPAPRRATGPAAGGTAPPPEAFASGPGAARLEVGDLPAEVRDQRLEPVALKH